MKKIIAIVTILALATSITACGTQTKAVDTSKEYPTMIKITKLNPQYDTMVGVDANGEMWQLEGIEDYDVDDYVALIMNDYGTPDYLYDDVIVSYRYCGHAALFN